MVRLVPVWIHYESRPGAEGFILQGRGGRHEGEYQGA